MPILLPRCAWIDMWMIVPWCWFHTLHPKWQPTGMQAQSQDQKLCQGLHPEGFRSVAGDSARFQHPDKNKKNHWASSRTITGGNTAWTSCKRIVCIVAGLVWFGRSVNVYNDLVQLSKYLVVPATFMVDIHLQDMICIKRPSKTRHAHCTAPSDSGDGLPCNGAVSNFQVHTFGPSMHFFACF